MAEDDQPPNDTIFVTNLPAGIDKDLVQTAFEPYGTVVWTGLMQGQGKVAALVQFSSLEEAQGAVQLSGAVLFEGAEPSTIRYAKPRGSGKKGGGKDGGKGAANRFTPYKGGAPQPGGFQQAAVFQAAPTVYTPVATAAVFQMNGGKGGVGKGKDQGSIAELYKDLQVQGRLPGGQQWTNDDGALFIGGLPADTTNEDVYHIFSPFGAIAPRGVKAMRHPSGQCTGVAFVNFLDPEHAQAAIAALNGTPLKNGKELRVKIKTAKGEAALGGEA